MVEFVGFVCAYIGDSCVLINVVSYLDMKRHSTFKEFVVETSREWQKLEFRRKVKNVLGRISSGV